MKRPLELGKRLWNAMAAGVVGFANDRGPVLRLQVAIGSMERIDNIPVAEMYGFTSVPPNGTDAMVIFVDGDRSNGIVVGTGNQQQRPRGRQIGDVTVYGHGHRIDITADGITLTPATGKPVTITGDLHVTGDVTAGYGTPGRVAILPHRHNETGSVTQPPNPT